MNTVLTKSVSEAARFIKSGGIVAFPTETVYGLGADVFDAEAVAKIFKAKRRPGDNPLIAHVGELEQIDGLVECIPDMPEKLMNKFFPGPLTLVLKKSARVPSVATAGLDTIGVRMPASPLANEFLRACGTPVVAPSANISGRPSPTTWQAVYEDLNGRIDCILQGGATDIGLESTVVDCTSDPPVILRTGAVSLESLGEVVPDIGVFEAEIEAAPRSPGMRHKHYAPDAKVLIVDSNFRPENIKNTSFVGLERPVWEPDIVLVCDSVEDYARQVFEFFRQCDKIGIKTIYCQKVAEKGIGVALMDRLRRAESP